MNIKINHLVGFQEDSTMRKHNSCSRTTVISLSPLHSPVNRYVGLFSKAISDQKYAVREFRWRPAILRKTDIVILHWPSEIFITDGKFATFKSILKLAVIWLSKYLWRTRFIWVAHNAAPHDTKKSVRRLTPWFLRSVDGIIFFVCLFARPDRRFVSGKPGARFTCHRSRSLSRRRGDTADGTAHSNGRRQTRLYRPSSSL